MNGHRRSAGAGPGLHAPGFVLPTTDGGLASLESLLARRSPVLLVFSNPGCGPCQALLPKLARWQREHAGRLTVALISEGDRDLNAAKAQEHGMRDVLLQTSREVASAYETHGTPSAVLISADGTIASELAAGEEAITELVERSLNGAAATLPRQPERIRAASDGHSPGATQGLPAGSAVPELTWRDLDGKLVGLSDYRGATTALLLWNPRCGFCQQLLPEIRALRASSVGEQPNLVVITTGSSDENRALELDSPVVLDQTFETGRLLGASGTPSAALIGPKGELTAPLAVGGPAVMALLASQPDRLQR